MEQSLTSDKQSLADRSGEPGPPGMLAPARTRAPEASGATAHGSPHAGHPAGRVLTSGCARLGWARPHRRGARPAAYRTGVWVARGTLPVAVASGRALPRPQPLPEPLSDREIEVLRLVALGRSNAEIARELVVEVATVKTHLNNVYRKLDVHSRTQAVGRAGQWRLLQAR